MWKVRRFVPPTVCEPFLLLLQIIHYYWNFFNSFKISNRSCFHLFTQVFWIVTSLITTVTLGDIFRESTSKISIYIKHYCLHDNPFNVELKTVFLRKVFKCLIQKCCYIKATHQPVVAPSIFTNMDKWLKSWGKFNI